MAFILAIICSRATFGFSESSQFFCSLDEPLSRSGVYRRDTFFRFPPKIRQICRNKRYVKHCVILFLYNSSEDRDISYLRVYFLTDAQAYIFWHTVTRSLKKKKQPSLLPWQCIRKVEFSAEEIIYWSEAKLKTRDGPLVFVLLPVEWTRTQAAKDVTNYSLTDWLGFFVKKKNEFFVWRKCEHKFRLLQWTYCPNTRPSGDTLANIDQNSDNAVVCTHCIQIST